MKRLIRPVLSAAMTHRQLLIFTAARIGGLALKPLVIAVATGAGRNLFAESYALLVSALASLFVLTGGQTHIDYYKQRFGEGRRAVRHSFDRYFSDSAIQFLMVLPVIALLAWAWTSDGLLIAIIVALVGIEKFFDEDQRHFLFTKEYGRWSLSFSARVVLPSLFILAAMRFAPEPLVLTYAAGCIGSFLLYLALRRRHARLYRDLLARHLRAIASNGRHVVARFWKRWRSDYAFNQIWSFTSINLYMVDRFWVARDVVLPLDAYVFFDSILRAAVVGHSLFYFVPRRPELIKVAARPLAEFVRLPNVVIALVFAVGGLAAGLVMREITPAYRWVPAAMLVGMGVFYFLQSTGSLVVESVFWRTPRRKLVIIDVLCMAWIFGLFLLFRPQLWAIPWLAATGVVLRLGLYLWACGSRPSDKGAVPATADSVT